MYLYRRQAKGNEAKCPEILIKITCYFREPQVIGKVSNCRKNNTGRQGRTQDFFKGGVLKYFAPENLKIAPAEKSLSVGGGGGGFNNKIKKNKKKPKGGGLGFFRGGLHT